MKYSKTFLLNSQSPYIPLLTNSILISFASGLVGLPLKLSILVSNSLSLLAVDPLDFKYL